MTNPVYKSKRKRGRDKFLLNFMIGHGHAMELGNLMGLNSNRMDNTPLIHQNQQQNQNNQTMNNNHQNNPGGMSANPLLAALSPPA